MKKTLGLFSAFVLSSLFVCGVCFSEPTHPNEVGLYLNPDGTGPSGYSHMGGEVDIHLVLTKPANTEANNIPYSTIGFFECSLNFSPVPSGLLMYFGFELPQGSFNSGEPHDITTGVLEFVVAALLDYPIVVSNEAALLATLTFVNFYTGVTEIFLGPVASPRIPGEMAFMSEAGQFRVMNPISGSSEAPVFLFNGEPVSIESDSFGSVKALYR